MGYFRDYFRSLFLNFLFVYQEFPIICLDHWQSLSEIIKDPVLFMSSFTYNAQFVMPRIVRNVLLHRCMVDLPGATFFKKNMSPSMSSHQLTVTSQLKDEFHNHLKRFGRIELAQTCVCYGSTMHSYVHLSYCVWRTLFLYIHPSS